MRRVVGDVVAVFDECTNRLWCLGLAVFKDCTEFLELFG